AVKMGVAAMHDVSEGGVFGALCEMAQAANVGLTIELKKIPVRQETIEISEFFDINPYKMLSTGSLLMGTEDGNALVLALEAIGVPAVVIGKATDSNDKVLVNEDERRFLETTQTDELYKALV
ncbi:MAG: hydrogenase maturation factor, partial [Agathobacter sp.]|nr:hydrogenase maturation factor [Agathobacter sp.]